MNSELPPVDEGDPGRTYVFKKDEELERLGSHLLADDGVDAHGGEP